LDCIDIIRGLLRGHGETITPWAEYALTEDPPGSDPKASRQGWMSLLDELEAWHSGFLEGMAYADAEGIVDRIMEKARKTAAHRAEDDQ